MRLHIALVHHPVLNRRGQIVTSALTNVDLHDIPRTARAFEVVRTYMVTPVTEQRKLVEYVRDQWVAGSSAQWHPDRAEALRRMAAVPSVEDAVRDIAAREGARPFVVATSASPGSGDLGFSEVAGRLAADDRPHLLLFGTAWGLAPAVIQAADAKLVPIEAPSGYQHFSVRAAAAIVLDRLAGAIARPAPGLIPSRPESDPSRSADPSPKYDG